MTFADPPLFCLNLQRCTLQPSQMERTTWSDAKDRKCSKTTTPRFDSNLVSSRSRDSLVRLDCTPGQQERCSSENSDGHELESDSLAGTTTEKRGKRGAAAAGFAREDATRSPSAAPGRAGDIGELARVDENDSESTTATAHGERSTALVSVSARGLPRPNQIPRRDDGAAIRFELVRRRTTARRQQQQELGVSDVSLGRRAAREQKMGESDQKSSECSDGSRHGVRYRVGERCIRPLCVPSWSQRWATGAGWRQAGTGEIELTPSSLGSLDAEEREESLEYVCRDTAGHVGEVVNQPRQLFGCAQLCSLKTQLQKLTFAAGAAQPPIRGDFEAQRHWISLTASSLSSPLLSPSHSTISVPISDWYFHDLSYWGLDYPPLTAYHSLLLGAVARLSSRTAAFVELRPPPTSPPSEIAEWESRMGAMEDKGEMKQWMRATVVWGDLLVWVSAVVVYCRANFSKGRGDKAIQTVVSRPLHRMRSVD